MTDSVGSRCGRVQLNKPHRPAFWRSSLRNQDEQRSQSVSVIAIAQAVIGERPYKRAIPDLIPFVSYCGNTPELMFQDFQPFDFLPDDSQLHGRDVVSVGARMIGLVVQGEQVADGFDPKSEVTSMLDEREALPIVHVVSALIAF